MDTKIVPQGKILRMPTEKMAEKNAFQAGAGPEPFSPEAMLRMICKLYLQNKGLEIQTGELQRLRAEREVSRLQLVEALRDRVWKYQALFEQDAIGFAYHEMMYDSAGKPKDFRVLDANRAYIKMVGADPRGKTAAQFFPGSKADSFDWVATFGRVAQKGETVRFERCLPPHDQWYDCFAYQIKPDFFVAMFLNINERKIMEKALKKSEKKYRMLVNYSYDIIYTFTPEGVLSFVSPAWTKLLGHQVADVMGKSFQSFVHPDDVPKLWSWLKAIRESGEFLSCDEYRVLHLDRTWRWHAASAVAIKDRYGALFGFYGVARDITEHRKAEQELKSSQARYRALVDQSIEALALVDIKTQELVEINPRFTELLGYSLPEDAPLFVIDIVVDTQENLNNLYHEIIQKQGVFSPEPRLLRHKNGAEVAVERVARVIRIDGKEYLLASIRDMTEERRHQKELAASLEELKNKQELMEKINVLLVESQRALLQQATQDSLTGLPNRRAALDLLSKELARKKRLGEGLAIGMCVIDYFKTINETWGHQIGDEVLSWFSQTLNECVREYDTVARIGGDEFLIILPLKSGTDAVSVFERCCSKIANSKMKTKDGGELEITTSIGVAFATAESETDQLLLKADSALNRAKTQGRNCVVYALKP